MIRVMLCGYIHSLFEFCHLIIGYHVNNLDISSGLVYNRLTLILHIHL